jgi:hypothetical protein
MNLPEPGFVGFFPKITQPAPAWLGNESVREIGSVSTCISEGPEDWINHWQHNDLGFFDTADLAYELISQSPEKFDLYAYKLFPLRCLAGRLESVSIDLKLDNFPPNYEFLGYDIVTRSGPHFFECSPLSCNRGAAEYDVNQYCLIADRETAYRVLLAICQAGSYEPGPYYLFEVYRAPSRR